MKIIVFFSLIFLSNLYAFDLKIGGNKNCDELKTLVQALKKENSDLKIKLGVMQNQLQSNNTSAPSQLPNDSQWECVMNVPKGFPSRKYPAMKFKGVHRKKNVARNRVIKECKSERKANMHNKGPCEHKIECMEI